MKRKFLRQGLIDVENPTQRIVFDLNLYDEIRKHHSNPSVLSFPFQEHELIGKQIVDNNFESYEIKEGKIESVEKRWLCGWYVALLVKFNTDKQIICWKNISSISPDILQSIETSQKRFYLI
jgi:hypothetical protein